MNVLVIPEDFRNDQYILQPIIYQFFKSIGKTNIKIKVCQDPLLGGVGEALKYDRLLDIINRYKGMAQLFILCVDRDGIDNRKIKLDELEKKFGVDVCFLAENAWEEIETWALAGLELPKQWSWKDIRKDISVKENYFEKYAKYRGVFDGPGRGRKMLGEEASRRVSSIRQKCREDFGTLCSRLESSI